MASGPQDDKNRRESGGSRLPSGPTLNFLVLAALLLMLGMLYFAYREPQRAEIPYNFFLSQLGEEGEPTNIEFLKIGDRRANGAFIDPPAAPTRYDREGNPIPPKQSDGEPVKLSKLFWVAVDPPGSPTRSELMTRLATQNVQRVEIEHDSDNALFYTWLLLILLPVGLFLVLWIMIRRSQSQMFGGNGFFSSFSKSPARRFDADRRSVTFDDVAGLEGVKADLLEMVEYLRNPKKFQRLGGRIPKGVLLNGPPGTGKTLLARAVAGEAGVPFYSVSGSEFIQMFVGVGASRVRDLFRTAKENSPAIIFIDEIDAVGRQRGAGLGGGHDEREQTLNQILSEMDGFLPSESVIVIAATNRPDVLDPALLRPGRFDRHVTVGRPSQKGRLAIFKVHVRDVPLDDDVDLDRMASATIGLTGADIRNIVNEAALWAARQNHTKVSMADFEYARDKVLMGPKRDEVLNEAEKESTAYHEAGHAVAAWYLPHADRVHKVTIVPRGRTLGVTHFMPVEDKLSVNQKDLRDMLVVLLAGRAAERLIYGESSVGAQNDLERATKIARRMVTHWGMSERLGPISYKLSEEDPFLGREMHQQREFSEHTMELIDEEVSRILHDAAARAESLLTEQRESLESVARALIEREEIDEAEIKELIGPSAQSRAPRNGQPGGNAEDGAPIPGVSETPLDS